MHSYTYRYTYRVRTIIIIIYTAYLTEKPLVHGLTKYLIFISFRQQKEKLILQYLITTVLHVMTNDNSTCPPPEFHARVCLKNSLLRLFSWISTASSFPSKSTMSSLSVPPWTCSEEPLLYEFCFPRAIELNNSCTFITHFAKYSKQ